MDQDDSRPEIDFSLIPEPAWLIILINLDLKSIDNLVKSQKPVAAVLDQPYPLMIMSEAHGLPYSETLEQFLEYARMFPVELFMLAMKNNDDRVFSNILEKYDIGDLVDQAVTAGKPEEFAKFIKEQNMIGELVDAFISAVRDNRLSKVKFLTEFWPKLGFDPPIWSGLYQAAQSDNVEILEYLSNQYMDPIINNPAMDLAIRMNRPDLVKILLPISFSFGEYQNSIDLALRLGFDHIADMIGDYRDMDLDRYR